jgi:DNA-binding SARP family transcriptional activator/TolB-like protein
VANPSENPGSAAKAHCDVTTLSLRVLGAFEIDASGVSIPIASRRGRALLAYLALQPAHAESRERLATLFWGDRQDRQARQSLRQCLFALRKDLEAFGADILQVGTETVALDRQRVIVDASRFESLAQSDAPSDLCAAIDLYGGDFLQGLQVESEPFQEWLENQRARFHGLATVALQRAAATGASRSDGKAALAAAERLVRLDPLNETVQHQLVALLWRYRGRDTALLRAGEFVRLLRRELGVEPEAATRALIEAIQRDNAVVENPASIPLVDAPKPDAAVGDAPNRFFLRLASRPRRRGWYAVAGISVVLALVLVVYLKWQPGLPESGLRHAAHPPPAAETSWKPPGILAEIGVDTATLASNGISAVIVLPFTAVANSDGGGANRRLADLITDDLIADLSRLPQIRVIARQTAHFYGGQSLDVGALGSELGVRYVVDGRVQMQRQTLRIDASLVDTSSRLEVWSQRFERDYDDRFAAQDELINAIARALHLGVINTEDRRRPPAQHDAKIDDMLAHGWAAMANLVSLGTTSGADGYFDDVLQRDPDNVSALIGLGGYHAGIVAMFLVPDPDEHLQRANALLQKAIAKSPSSVLAYYYLGLVHKARGQLPEALKDFTKVVQEDPSLPLGYAQVGHLVSRMGRPDEAMEYIRYAVRLNPKDPNMGLVGLMAGEIELERGNDAAALDWFKRSLALAPISPFAHAAMGAALALSGDTANAAKQADEVRQLAPWLTLDQMVARLVATSQPGHEPGRLIDGLRREFADAR